MNKNDHNNSHSEKQKSLLTLEHLREYLLECDLPTPEIALLRSAIKRVDEIIGHGLLDVAATDLRRRSRGHR